ncbi:MAG TPA: TIM-barrel domain-containing protein [Candidatus Acidoferrales bacterium]|nr:TIM-barrel domain-containing protein [Candidatus Acidoferrales bacterium]
MDPFVAAMRAALAISLLAASVSRAEPGQTVPKAELVAPGIWKIHLGEPEKFTPTFFRTAPVDQAGLKNLPEAATMPLEAGLINFQVSSHGCAVRLPMAANESIYGFGLNTELFDMTRTATGHGGRRVFLKPTDHPENDLGESHAPVPFYVSSRGYGVFVDTARYASFYTGNASPAGAMAETENGVAIQSVAELYRPQEKQNKTMLVDIPAAKGVDVYIFAGPVALDAVRRFNLFSGGGCVPPLWGLGIQYRGDGQFGADETLKVAAQLRADHIPCDVWGVEPGWQTKTYSCSFVWKTNKFNDPDDFIRQMHQQDFRVNFWEHAFTHPSSPMYAALKSWSGDYAVWGGLVPDFAAADGRRIFLNQNRQALFDKGVDGVKLDECDDQPDSATPWSFPVASKFPSGLDGEQMHSLFGLLYQQTMLKPYAEKSLRTWGLVRNSQALAAPLPYVLYSDSYDHRCYVRGLVNSGFSGLLWTPEVRDAATVEDLYRRVETVIFSPEALINCWYIKNPPWLQIDKEKNNNNEWMPDHQQVTDSIRKLLQLRMSFVPYLYSAFNEYHLKGTPPIRALVLDWPDDPAVRGIDDQYMFGASVMVAPMFSGQKSRTVYLPAGDWFDFWTQERIAGGRSIETTNGAGQPPLFVKANTLLPFAEPVESIQTNTCFKITVKGFGVKSADFALYEDDGVSLALEKGDQKQIRLHWDDRGHSQETTGHHAGPARYQIAGWQPVE